MEQGWALTLLLLPSASLKGESSNACFSSENGEDEEEEEEEERDAQTWSISDEPDYGSQSVHHTAPKGKCIMKILHVKDKHLNAQTSYRLWCDAAHLISYLLGEN